MNKPKKMYDTRSEHGFLSTGLLITIGILVVLGVIVAVILFARGNSDSVILSTGDTTPATEVSNPAGNEVRSEQTGKEVEAKGSSANASQ